MEHFYSSRRAVRFANVPWRLSASSMDSELASVSRTYLSGSRVTAHAVHHLARRMPCREWRPHGSRSDVPLGGPGGRALFGGSLDRLRTNANARNDDDALGSKYVQLNISRLPDP